MKIYKVLFLLVFAAIFFMYCTKTDQIVVASSTNTTDLVSYKTATAPTIDGTIDAIWANAPALNVTPTVPDPGNGLFAGYSGETYPATLRSMYDDQYIYFLAEWKDVTNNPVQPWYFNPDSALAIKMYFSHLNS
jgi:hypothetical protein